MQSYRMQYKVYDYDISILIQLIQLIDIIQQYSSIECTVFMLQCN